MVNLEVNSRLEMRLQSEVKYKFNLKYFNKNSGINFLVSSIEGCVMYEQIGLRLKDLTLCDCAKQAVAFEYVV